MENKLQVTTILRTLAIFLSGAALTFAAHPKVAPEISAARETAMLDVIVQYRHPPTEAHHRALAAHGAHKSHLHSINGDLVHIRASEAAALAEDPEVAYITPDRPVHGSLDLSTAAVNAGAAEKQYGLTGAGIGVAVLDSGIYSHDDLANKVVYGTYSAGSDPDDHFGHGTHVAGIIAGSAKDSLTGKRTFLGVAPGVNLIDIRVLDRDGDGSDSSVIQGIQTAIGLKATYNIRVINLSLGRPVSESYVLDPLCQAVEAAWKAGIVVVVAAGNDGRTNYSVTGGYGTITAPGNDPYVITVGAMKANGTPARGDDTIASYSSKGPTLFDHVVKPDLVAPGNRVVSLLAPGTFLPTTYPQNSVATSYYLSNGTSTPSTAYFLLSGTSMATPVVSGAAALLLQQNPNLTPDQVKARLMKTAYKGFPSSSTVVDPASGLTYRSQYDILTVGAGYLDIGAALGNHDVAALPATSPTLTISAKGQVDLVYGTAVIWGSSSPWGTAVIWGSTVNISLIPDSGSAVIWGSSSMTGLAVIWGSSSPLSSSTTSTASADAGVLINGEP